MDLCPYLFSVSFYHLYFFLPPSEDNGLSFWVSVSSASIQKLFCGICSALKCSFNEFVGEKVVSTSYSPAILGAPPRYVPFGLLVYTTLYKQMHTGCLYKTKEGEGSIVLHTTYMGRPCNLWLSV